MPKKQDWLDIIEKASELKKGTKIPKDMDIYSLTMLMYPSPNQKNNSQNNGSMSQFGTGAGADGVVQPGKPAALDMGTNPPSVYHEGETVVPFPGGKNIIPAQTETEQQQLGTMQQQKRLPGYQTGGTVYEDPLSLDRQTSTRPTNTLTTTPQQSTYQTGVNQAFKTTQQRAAGTDPLMENISNRALQDYDIRAAVSDTATRQQLASQPYLTEGAKRAVTAKQQATYSGGLSSLVGDLSQQSMERAEEANQQLYEMGRTGVQDEQTKQQWEKTFGEQQYQTDIAQQQWQESFDFEKEKYGDLEFGRMADDAQTTSLESWLQKYPNATAADYATAREYKALQLQSMGIANATASENLLQLQKSDKWNDAQQFLEAGDYENYRALVQEITGRDISTADFEEDRAYLTRTREQAIVSGDLQLDAQRLGITTAQMQALVDAVNSGVPVDTINAQYGTNLTQEDANSIGAKYVQGLRAGEAAITAQDIANDAAMLGISRDQFATFVDVVNSGGDLAAANEASGLNLTQDQFDSIQEKYRQQVIAGYQGLESGELANDAARIGVETTRLNAFINAVNNGADLATANATSGLNLTQDQYDSIATKYRQGIEATEASIVSMKNKVGDEIYNSIINMINTGASLKLVNDRLAANGIPPITAEEFQGAYDATALGERNWGRQLTAANMLLSTPGAVNKDRAEAAYNDLFPGVTFDFDKIASEEHYEDFADGLSLMAEYVASDMTFEEAYGLLQAGGVVDKLGVEGPANLRNLYNAMKVNAIDSQWDEMESSDFWKSLTPEEQDDQREFFKQSMLGQLDYTTMHEYEILNPDGTLNMTIYAKNSEEADKKAMSLGEDYSVKDTGNVKFQMTSTLTGEGGSLAGQTTTRPIGETYIENGRLYKVGAGQVIEELKFDSSEDAWTAAGNEIIDLGKENNPYYQEVMDARAQSIIDGTHKIGNKIDDPELYSAMMNVTDTDNLSPTMKTDKDGNQVMGFGTEMDVGSVFKYTDGKLYKITSEPTSYLVTGRNYATYVNLVDLSTGDSKKISTKSDGSTYIS